MNACHAKNFNDLKIFFNSVDFAHGYTVFDIGGNNYRLITAMLKDVMSENVGLTLSTVKRLTKIN